MKHYAEIEIDVSGTQFMPQGSKQSLLWLAVWIEVPEKYAGYLIDRGKRFEFYEYAQDASALSNIVAGAYVNPNDETDEQRILESEKMAIAFHFGALIIEKALESFNERK